MRKMSVFTLLMGVALAGTRGWAQAPSAASPAPQLSTAEKIAIQQCERAKSDAQKAFTEAQQQELMIEREWGAAHPGFHINTQSFAVEKDSPVPVPPKVEPPKK